MDQKLIEAAIKALEKVTGKTVKLVEAEELNELTKALVNRAFDASLEKKVGDPLHNMKRNTQSDKFSGYVSPELTALAYRLGFSVVGGNDCVHVYVESTGEDEPVDARRAKLTVRQNKYSVELGDISWLRPDRVKKLATLIRKIQADLTPKPKA